MPASRGTPTGLSLGEIVEKLGGRLIGNPSIRIARLASLESAAEDCLTFFSNPRYKGKLRETKAAAVIVPTDSGQLTSLPRIESDNPYLYFARLSQLWYPVVPPAPGCHGTAVVDATAEISPEAYVGPHSVIGRYARVGSGAVVGAGCVIGDGVSIGNNCTLNANVTVHCGCHIGSGAILHSGVVIGADGFGIANDSGRWIKIPQVGAVIIGSDVEIGANTTIDRGALDDTIIEDGVKLDNQIQIGHNCIIGAHTAMAGCVAVAGSARIGRNCTVGAAAIILGHLSITDSVNISAGTVVSRSIRVAGTYSGFFPFDDNASWTANAAQLRNLDKLADKVKLLEKRLSDLEGKSD